MPHVIVKLYAGRTNPQKKRLAELVTGAVTAALNCDEQSVSVAIEDISPSNWGVEVYEPDILGKHDKIYKQPGYTPPR